MSEYPEIIVLRHGETEWNRENRMQGALNSRLTEKGITQAQHQLELLSQFDLRQWDVFCSPQGRAVQTAGFAVAPLVDFVSSDPLLCEIGVGEWQGKIRDQLDFDGARHDGPDGPIALYEHAPGGEGFDRLEERCRAFLGKLTRPTVIVTHGITSRMLRITVLGLGRSELGTIAGGQGNIFHLKDGVQKEFV